MVNKSVLIYKENGWKSSVLGDFLDDGRGGVFS